MNPGIPGSLRAAFNGIAQSVLINAVGFSFGSAPGILLKNHGHMSAQIRDSFS
jgi:hypothetical protein